MILNTNINLILCYIAPNAMILKIIGVKCVIIYYVTEKFVIALKHVCVM
jgi:uncharacterized protein (DUF927 family)